MTPLSPWARGYGRERQNMRKTESLQRHRSCPGAEIGSVSTLRVSRTCPAGKQKSETRKPESGDFLQGSRTRRGVRRILPQWVTGSIPWTVAQRSFSGKVIVRAPFVWPNQTRTSGRSAHHLEAFASKAKHTYPPSGKS